MCDVSSSVAPGLTWIPPLAPGIGISVESAAGQGDLEFRKAPRGRRREADLWMGRTSEASMLGALR
eukprot:13042106-Alexandrium_andersonii.AAC.1